MFGKRLMFFVLALLCLMFSGCMTAGDDPADEVSHHSGLIYSIEENRILVVHDINSVNIPWNSWFEAGNRAIVFSFTADTVIELEGETVNSDKLKRGQTVEILYSGALAESYPEQGAADKVIIVNAAAAADKMTDSGLISELENLGDELLISIRISGTPDEIPPRVYKLTPEAGELISHLNLEAGNEIIFHYIGDEETTGLIYDLSLLNN